MSEHPSLAPATARWIVRVDAGFEAAHALRDYVGGPEPIHGHSWRVEVAIETDRLGDFDLAVDFVPLRRLLDGLVRRFDTRFINEIPPFDEVNPSTENLARFLVAEIAAAGVVHSGARLAEVTVWEGPHNRVTYAPQR